MCLSHMSCVPPGNTWEILSLPVYILVATSASLPDLLASPAWTFARRRYSRVGLLFPEWRPVVAILANAAPDLPFKMLKTVSVTAPFEVHRRPRLQGAQHSHMCTYSRFHFADTDSKATCAFAS